MKGLEKNFEIEKKESDISILQDSLKNLHFVNGISIYLDKTKTKRKKFITYSNIDAWLASFSQMHKVSFFELRALVKKLIDDFNSNFILAYEHNKRYDLTKEFEEELVNLLKCNNQNNEVSYETFLNSLFSYYSNDVIDNNFSIVSKDGAFIMSNQRMSLPWFYNNIKINDYGLFECEERELIIDGRKLIEDADWNIAEKPRYTSGTIRTSSRFLIWDAQSNCLSKDEFYKSIEILSNSTDNFEKLLADKPKINFNVGNGAYYEYSDLHEGEKEADWDIVLPNGLTYYYITRSQRGSDYKYFADPYVKDKNGNCLPVKAFYLSLCMLNNGKHLTNAILADYTNIQIKANVKS